MAAVLSPILSPPKVVLLAAQFAATGAVSSLAALTAHYRDDILTTELLLRLLLTYLPTHLPTAVYLPFLESLVSGDFSVFFPLPALETASVNGLSDEQAAKKVRRLRLRPLDGENGNNTNNTNGDSPKDWDLFSSFLLLRAYAVDDGAGALPELPALVAPFLDRDPSNRLRTWAVSTLLPLLRRNCEYYPGQPLAQTTLADFEHLPDRVAVARLLSQTGQETIKEEANDGRTTDGPIGRDLRGIIGPWLHSERRWPRRRGTAASANEGDPTALCPGWEEVLRWLVAQAAGPSSWRVAVAVVEQWNGPDDVDLGGFGSPHLWLADNEQQYLMQRYAQAALASVYVVPKASAEALSHVHGVVTKIRTLLGLEAAAAAHVATPHLQTAASLLPPVSPAAAQLAAAHSNRRDLLSADRLLDPPGHNPLTTPTAAATELLLALVLSAHLLTSRLGCPCTVRRAADLALLLRGGRDDQMAEAAQVLRWMAGNGPKGEDRYWIKARNEILWLRDWGADEHDENEAENKPDQLGPGIFGQVSREYIETEFLKALLANTRYTLARALYEEAPDHPLPKKVVRDTIFATAMSAYDNASNPNRTRGGLKKCDAIIRAFPRTIPPSLPEAKRTEALLAATHALSTYRLVLKQGEPFTPVVLRVHPDPISILGKVLEQNHKSYTHIRALVDIAQSMVAAGLTTRSPEKTRSKAATSESEDVQNLETQRILAEHRVTAMCIDAALSEDDFETAYSYVVGRLSANSSNGAATTAADTWSWRAALEAGRYHRSERTIRPTHLGTASANLEIRHLEQRIDCLATALRIAPVDTLQEILNAYRRAEEELEVAVQAEAQQESAWDDAGDWQQQPPLPPQQQQQQTSYNFRRSQTDADAMPGGFERSSRAATSSNLPLASRAAAAAAASASASASKAATSAQQTADEAPLSLFDLSRATARVAQRNLSALASLRQTRQAVFGSGGSGSSDGGSSEVKAPTSVPTTLLPRSSTPLQAASDADSERDVFSSAATTPLRKRDQLREAAMGTLTSGVGWLIGAQPVDRERLRPEE